MALQKRIKQQHDTGFRISRLVDEMLNDKRFIDNPNAEYYEVRMQLLEAYWDDFQNRHKKLNLEKKYNESSYARQNQFKVTELTYLTGKLHLSKRLQTVGAGLTPLPEMDEKQLQEKMDGYHPALPLPHFSGDDWPYFRGFFKFLVHDNPHITSMDRLLFLKQALGGKPAELVESINVADALYNTAWNTLEKAYENKMEEVSTHIKAMVTWYTKNEKGDVDLQELVKFFTNTRESLQKLNYPVEMWDDWFVYFMAKKLPPKVKSDWEMVAQAGLKLPSFEDICKFLNNWTSSEPENDGECRHMGDPPDDCNDNSNTAKEGNQNE